MFKKIQDNLVESDEGFTVETLGLGGIKYKEGSKTFYIDSEIIVDPPIDVRAKPLPGSYGMLVYKKRIRDFDSPIESHAPIDDEKRNEIIENIHKAFLFWGYKFEVEESY
ncbi:MAG: hypothetical protein H8E17_00785 [Deltaproteobacteria bacterium]|nr:hypothetical protein [Deltaproteobacteria bacterium]